MSNRQLTEKQRAAIRWVAALRSGRYNQCIGAATRAHKDGRMEHCAIAAFYAEIGVPHDYWLEDVKALFGAELLASVIDMNDSRRQSFAEIADYIEEMVLAELRVMA